MTEAADFIDAADASGTGASGTISGPPQIVLRSSVGSGKTRLYISEIKAVLTRDPVAVAFVFVSDHGLAAEVEKRIQAEIGPGFRAAIWRGTDQDDPDAPAGMTRKMCQRSGDADLVWDAAGTLKDLCGSIKRGFCPHHPKAAGGCGYIEQAEKAKSGTASVWVLPHAMLGRRAPEPLRRFIRGAGGNDIPIPAADFVVIDESFWRAMLGKVVVSLDMMAPALWPAVPDNPNALEPVGFADGLVCRVLRALSGAFTAAGTGGRVGKGALAFAGLTAGECREAGGYILRCKVDLPADDLPVAAGRKVKDALRKVAANNRRVLRVHRLFNVAADVLDGRLGSAALAVRDGKNGPEVAPNWRNEIADDWLGAKYGIIHADATMSEEIARVWLPRLVVPSWTPVAAPHMHVKQIGDRAFGYSAVVKGKQGQAGQKAAANNARRVQRAIETLAARFKGKGAPGGPDVLVVLPKATEDELRGKLPSNVGTLHFGKLRGQDDFKGVAALLVVSRVLPGAGAMEDAAEVIFGQDVSRLPPGAFYPARPGTRRMADGTGRAVPRVNYHPDPLVEIVRRACCEDELTQAIGRGRGIHRTAANPLLVILMNNVPIDDVPVSEVVALDDLWRDLAGTDPVRELEAAGVLPTDWPGLAAVLAGRGFFTGAGDKADACRAWFRDNPRDGKRLAGIRATAAGVETANVGETSYKNSSIGEISDIRASGSSDALDAPAALNPAPAAPVWPSFRYRRAGQRKSGRVLISPKHTNPRAAAEALLGALDVFGPEGTTPPAKWPRRAVLTPDAVPDAAPPAVPALTTPAPVPSAVPATRTPAVAPQAAPPAPAFPVPVAAPLAPAPQAVPVPPVAGVPAPPVGDLNAKLDAVPIGLPALMSELVAAGAINAARRRQHMDRFRSGRGPAADRERATIARLASEIGSAAVIAACRAAAARKLGTSAPETPAQPNGAAA